MNKPQRWTVRRIRAAITAIHHFHNNPPKKAEPPKVRISTRDLEGALQLLHFMWTEENERTLKRPRCSKCNRKGLKLYAMGLEKRCRRCWERSGTWWLVAHSLRQGGKKVP